MLSQPQIPAAAVSYGGCMMKQRMRVLGLLLLLVAACPSAISQQKKKSAEAPAGTVQHNPTQQKNIDEYIELLRSNVRQDKAEILGAVMQLSAADAAKFWPIYSDYDAELSKLNKQRIDNIQEYARTYDDMTDAKADELIMSAMSYQKQRSELLAKYYGLVKPSIGAIQAARFVQVEHQLLLIIDLQIASNLPLVSASDAAQGAK
jgi:hypothetical protein